MKNLTKVISLLLCAVMLFALAACNKNDTPTDNKPDKTAYNLVQDGVSEYKIVLSATATANELFAANELANFLNLATGAELEIVTDDEYPSSDAIIAIGNTKQAQAANAVSGQNLATSSFVLKTVGNSLYVTADKNGDGEACLYGVYQILQDAVNFRVYAADEIGYDTDNDTIPLYNYDKVYKPTFDQRELGYASIANDETYKKRMRLVWHDTDVRWTLHGHTQASHFVNPDFSDTLHPEHEGMTYGQAHPDWFDGGQLCWSAGAEMERVAAEKLIRYIENYPQGEYIMLGQMDNTDYCSCDRCKKKMAELGINPAGMQILFLNNVIKIAEQWRAENRPEQDVKYVTFAYNGTLQPPVKKDGNGNLVAINDQVKPHDKLYIYFTPIETDFAVDLSNQRNLSVMEALNGWNALASGRIMVYIYDINFHNYFINFNNFGTVEGMYRDYLDNGVYYMYSQGPIDTCVPCFQEMRVFVESQLMWDIGQGYDNLVNEFMQAYYRDAAPAVRKFYELIRNRYARYYAVDDTSLGGGIYDSIGDSDIWTENLVNALGDALDDALSAVEKYKTTDNELYAKLHDRIMKEYLSVIFLKLSYYQASYTSAQIAEMKANFKYYTTYFQITNYAENDSLEGLFD